MSFNFTELESKYRTDAHFNRLVRCFEELLKEHGFLPSELRESLFFAQYRFEVNAVERIIRSKEEWEQIEKAREMLKTHFTGLKATLVEQ